MIHRLVLKVVPQPHITRECYEVNGQTSATGTLFIEAMKSIGEEVPAQPYTAVYTLAPKHGKLVCNLHMMKRFGSENDYRYIYNCYLPIEWHGLRVNRKVVLS